MAAGLASEFYSTTVEESQESPLLNKTQTSSFSGVSSGMAWHGSVGNGSGVGTGKMLTEF